MGEVERSYTPAEAAQIIGSSTWWVEEQARRRRVPHQRFGRGRVRFTATQVQALRDLATVEPVTPQALPNKALAALGTTARSQAAHRSRRAKAAGST